MDHIRDFVQAASQGNLEALTILQQQHPTCQWPQQACTAAARRGQLHVLKALRSCSPPCPWTADVCTAAAGAGFLEILQWARANGCQWNESTFEAAWGNRWAQAVYDAPQVCHGLPACIMACTSHAV